MKRVIVGILVLVMSLSLIFALTGCSPYSIEMKTGDVQKRTSLDVNEDGTFTVMQLTDLHLTTHGTFDMDKQTLRWVGESIDKVKPDLVEITGDAVAGGPDGRNKALIALANIFEEKKVYWAYTFGNHDGEHSVKEDGSDWWIGKEGKQTLVKDVCSNVETTDLAERLFFGDNTKGNKELFELLKGYEYCLLTRSEEELQNETAMGVGNYVIELKNGKDETVFALFHMDTHGKIYVDPKGNTEGADGYVDVGYLGLTDMQVDWYENKVKSYSEQGIASAIFMHVPNYGYREVFEASVGANKYGVPQFAERADIKYWAEQYLIPEELKEIEFIKEEGVYAPRWDEGLMDVIKDNPSTGFISVGHDHNNSFMTYVDGVIMGYGRTSGVNAWSRDIGIGATVIKIDTNEKDLLKMFDISQVYPDFKYKEKGNR